MEEKITCLICKRRFSQINNFHLKTHGLTPKKYLKKFRGAKLFSNSLRNKIQRENYKDWSNEEDRFLLSNYGKISIDKIAVKLKRSRGSASSRKVVLEKRGFKFEKFCVDCGKDISNRINSSRCKKCAEIRRKHVKQIGRAKERKFRYCIDCGKDLWLTRRKDRCLKCAEMHRGKYKIKYYKKRREIWKKEENKKRLEQGLPLVGEGWISELIMKNFLNKILENERCIDNRNYRNLKFLELDRYYPDLGIAFEYQGEQHFKPVRWNSKISSEKSLKLLKEQQKRDQMKRKHCKKNGIALVEISFREKLSADTLIKKIKVSKNKVSIKKVKKFNEKIRKELDNEEILELWNEGYSIAGIERVLHWSHSAIRLRLEKLGVKPEYRKFTDEELKEELKKGLSQKEIAKNLGVNQRAIYERMKRLGLKSNFPTRKELMKITDKELINELNKGLSQEEIARRYNISTTAIRERRKKLNLKTNFPTNEERRKFTDSELIEQVENGKTVPEMMRHLKVKRGIIPRHIKRLGLKVNSAKKEYSKKELLSILKEIFKKEGTVPTTKILDSNPEYPSHTVYNKNFGSFVNALVKAGFLVRKKNYTEEEALGLLRDLCEKLGRLPVCRDLKNNKDLPSFHFYRKMFGSWKKTLREARLIS